MKYLLSLTFIGLVMQVEGFSQYPRGGGRYSRSIPSGFTPQRRNYGAQPRGFFGGGRRRIGSPGGLPPVQRGYDYNAGVRAFNDAQNRGYNPNPRDYIPDIPRSFGNIGGSYGSFPRRQGYGVPRGFSPGQTNFSQPYVGGLPVDQFGNVIVESYSGPPVDQFGNVILESYSGPPIVEQPYFQNPPSSGRVVSSSPPVRSAPVRSSSSRRSFSPPTIGTRPIPVRD